MSTNPKFDPWQKKYPNLFKEYPRSGFYAGAGWEALLHNLCSILEAAILQMPNEIRGGIYCVQVKEKFGGLRFYLSQETPYLSGAIAMAESMSHCICEQCGKPGKLRPGSYIQVLCDPHFKAKEKKKK